MNLLQNTFILFLALGACFQLKASQGSAKTIAFEMAAYAPQEDEESEDGENSKWGEDSATAVMKYSLYREFYKKDNYEDAYEGWSWVFKNAPEASINIYINGSKMLNAIIKKESDEEQKLRYLDTLMMLYDQRIEYFGKEGMVLGKKGSDLLVHNSKEIEQAYDYMKKGIGMTEENSVASTVYYFMTASVNLHKIKKIDLEQLIDDYVTAMEIINHNLEAGGKSLKSWEKIDAMVGKLTAKYINCETLVELYDELFEKNKESVEEVKGYVNILEKNNCNKEPIFLKMSEVIYEAEPSAEAAINLAKGYDAIGQNDKAITYYKEALEREEDPAKKADLELSLAKIYKNRNAYSTARNHARKALQHNPNLGSAHILIGDVYVAGSGDCGSGFDKQTVYWVAVDHYEKAKNVDASLKELAQKRIATYSEGFPKQDDAFFQDLSEGDSYTVECWINETTTVRIRKGE